MIARKPAQLLYQQGDGHERAAVVRTRRKSTERPIILYSLNAQLYGIEVEHRNKQDNICCKAYDIGGTSVCASAVRRYSNNRINTERSFLAEAHLDD